MYKIRLDEKEKFILQVICGVIVILGAAYIAWSCIVARCYPGMALETIIEALTKY